MTERLPAYGMTSEIVKKAEDLREWFITKSGSEWRLIAKILSGNDTLANDTHQAGAYVPKEFVFEIFPSVAVSRTANPRRKFASVLDSHGVENTPTAIWYNNRAVSERPRDEARFTGWGGSGSPLLAPDSTGSVVVFAFRMGPVEAEECRIWLCASTEEEDVVFEHLGPVEPGKFAGDVVSDQAARRDRSCTLSEEEIEPGWILKFPSTADVVTMTVLRLTSARQRKPDDRLLARRECEYAIFRSIEAAAVLPRIREGFGTVDIFVDYANSVTNRRKARSGASLGLQLTVLLAEENVAFSYDAISEGRKRPDFLFPSAEAYRKANEPSSIRMLAAKTTCKDRWRQILNEADKVHIKYLLTLQHGVSINQHLEMKQAGVVLVVPRPLHKKYPDSVRPDLLDVSRFIKETRSQCGGDG